MRIVVVEDEPDISRLYRTLLEADGHTVSCITRAADALTGTGWADVDVAVVDLMMPEVSGEVVLRYLVEHQPHVRRIVGSAVDITAKVAGLAHVVLRKPFSPDALSRALR